MSVVQTLASETLGPGMFWKLFPPVEVRRRDGTLEDIIAHRSRFSQLCMLLCFLQVIRRPVRPPGGRLREIEMDSCPPTPTSLRTAPAPTLPVLNDLTPPRTESRTQITSEKLSPSETGIGSEVLVRYTWVDPKSHVNSG